MKTDDIIDPVLQQHNRIMELEQQVEKLRQQVKYLQAQLHPPEPPKRELKYWIVTWLDDTIPKAHATDFWPDVLSLQDELRRKQNISTVRILKQIVYV